VADFASMFEPSVASPGEPCACGWRRGFVL